MHTLRRGYICLADLSLFVFLTCMHACTYVDIEFLEISICALPLRDLTYSILFSVYLASSL